MRIVPQSISKKREDIFLIHDLDTFIYKALKNFYEATEGKKPHAIIYFRDGLSEGQYDKVVKFEMTMLRQGIRRIQEDYEPNITMLSVQRRHNVKFFCEHQQDCIGRANNVPSGTVIDHDVTSPDHYDFYMYAHAGAMVRFTTLVRLYKGCTVPIFLEKIVGRSR